MELLQIATLIFVLLFLIGIPIVFYFGDSPSPESPDNSDLNDCPNCNKTQNDNATFCKDCGAEISPKELITIAYCEKCESEYDESNQFCENDGNKLVLKEKEIDESPNNITDAPKDSNEIDKDKVTDLPMNWYQAFTYAILPLFIIFCAMTLNWWGGFFTLIAIVSTPILIFGFSSMREWAPPFFNFYIFTSFLPILFEYNNVKNDFAYAYDIPIEPIETEIMIAIILFIWIFWSAPNYAYFNRRKHLFVN
jgi:hypothetical protein